MHACMIFGQEDIPVVTQQKDVARVGRARQIAVPADARALSTLSRVDYEDAFLVETGLARERTGEQWARAMLEDAPAATRRALRWTWLALGLRLGSTRDERRVFGWELRRSSPDFALLAARSLVGLQAEVLLKRGRDSVLCASFLRVGNPVARAVWSGIAQAHRRAVPDLLTRAARRAAEQERMDES
jgi:hypothetical protein